jgi:hypothetical protein
MRNQITEAPTDLGKLDFELLHETLSEWSGASMPETKAADQQDTAAGPRKRMQLSKEQKRAQAEQATQVAFADNQRRHKEREEKTARLRASRLAHETGRTAGS